VKLIKFAVQFTLFSSMMGSVISLSGCQSTAKSQVAVGPSVGPGSGKALGDKTRSYPYQSSVYLNVAVPVFDPGIPADYSEVEDQQIWPQLRRAEATRFAVLTKQSLQKTGVFGNVSVVPTPATSADLFVLGRIDESNSQDVKINIELVDISGRRWGEKAFEHRVSEGFFRDKQNNDNDSYSPIFSQIGDYVYQQLLKKAESDKQALQQITDLRFAQSLSPSYFSNHLSTDTKGFMTVNSLPGEGDPMMLRIEPLQIQEQLFIDRLQTQYDGFNRKTDESYHLWQKETLPAMVAASAADSASLFKGFLGGAAILVAAINADDDLSTTSKIATGAAAIGGIYLIKEAFGSSAEAKIHRASIDQLGETIDIQMDDQVLTLKDKTIELSGTAEQQYEQYKAHLKRIYQLEKTPDQDL
jgi:outer membrane murein-binding lipoprotein Lpp